MKIDKTKVLYHLAIMTCLLAFYAIFFFPIYGGKLFYIAGYLIIFIGLSTFRTLGIPKKNKLVFLAMLAFSLSLLLWEMKYHNNGAFTSVYDSYRTTGKILLLSAILTFFLSHDQFKIEFQKITLYLIIGGVVVNLFALYQGHNLQEGRIELAFDRATIAAYLITVVDILMLYAILCIKSRIRLFLFCLGLMMSMSAIFYTGTRMAMVTYLLLVIIVLFLHPEVKRAHLLYFLLVSIATIAVSGVLFYDKLEKRVNGIYQDLNSFAQQNSKTSVGARLAMWKTGVQAGIFSPWGSSAEKRAQNINQQIAHSPSLSGTADYLNVHLHNEVIENFSLRGTWGAFIVIFFYFSLLYSAWHNQDRLLFIITLSMIMYGMTDVIFFSREATIVYSLAIILSQVMDCRCAVMCQAKHPYCRA